MESILLIFFFTIFFGANPPSAAFMTFLGIYLVICIVLAVIAGWKDGDKNERN